MGSVTEVAERSQVAERTPSHERRKLAIALIFIGCVALAVAWLGDPRAASFSDAGGRLATVKTMAETNTWLPDLGYWAEAVDPGGGDHPILFTLRYGDRWVEVTSLPLVVVGRPLWEIGGARAVVLLPVLSVVLAAYAARGCRGGHREATGGSRSGSSVCCRRCSSTAPTSGSTLPPSRRVACHIAHLGGRRPPSAAWWPPRGPRCSDAQRSARRLRRSGSRHSGGDGGAEAQRLPVARAAPRRVGRNRGLGCQRTAVAKLVRLSGRVGPCLGADCRGRPRSRRARARRRDHVGRCVRERVLAGVDDRRDHRHRHPVARRVLQRTRRARAR